MLQGVLSIVLGGMSPLASPPLTIGDADVRGGGEEAQELSAEEEWASVFGLDDGANTNLDLVSMEDMYAAYLRDVSFAAGWNGPYCDAATWDIRVLVERLLVPNSFAVRIWSIDGVVRVEVAVDCYRIWRDMCRDEVAIYDEVFGCARVEVTEQVALCIIGGKLASSFQRWLGNRHQLTTFLDIAGEDDVGRFDGETIAVALRSEDRIEHFRYWFGDPDRSENVRVAWEWLQQFGERIERGRRVGGQCRGPDPK